MNSLLNYGFILLVFICTVFVAEYGRASKSWLIFSLALCMLLRMAVAMALSGGLKYVFVLDSLSYEMNGWLLAQSWISPNLFLALTPSKAGGYNAYEVLLSWIFQVFGRETLTATIFNCFLSTAAIALIVNTYQAFFTTEQIPNSFRKSSLILTIVLSLYPSYLVWSATNTRDPLYFCACALFFNCFFRTFSARSKAIVPMRIFTLAGSSFAVWVILGVRGYVIGLLAFAICAGILLSTLRRFYSIQRISVFTAATCLLTLTLIQLLNPSFTAHWLTELAEVRLGFANINLADSVAKSSFGLEYGFHTLFDLLWFLPNALAHYFFGPFIWEVSSLVQAISLLEAAAVFLCLYPTLRGMRDLYRRAPFETTTIICFAFTFAITQSLVISNMGTIFRHRSLPFLFLSIFACEGLSDVAEKYIPTFLSA